jgi:hypothetical protein
MTLLQNRPGDIKITELGKLSKEQIIGLINKDSKIQDFIYFEIDDPKKESTHVSSPSHKYPLIQFIKAIFIHNNLLRSIEPLT